MLKFVYKNIYSLWINRVKPIKAFKAIRALDKNKEDTTQVFHVIDSLKGASDKKYFKIFSNSIVGKNILKRKIQLVDTLKDKEFLKNLPKESLGYKYYEFIYKENLSPEELIDASNNINLDKHFQHRSDEEIFFNTRKRDMHDLWHVTAGYGRDALGELSLLAFTYAQEQNRGIGAIALYGYWKVGKVLPEDWEHLIQLPLDQVRKKLNSEKPELYYDALKKLNTQEIDLDNNAVLVN